MGDHIDASGPGPLGAWLGELAQNLAGLVASYVPGSGGVDARTRERLVIAVSEDNDAPSTAWVHAAWLDFLGDRELGEELVPLFDYAQACARAGRPVDTTALEAVYPPQLVGSVRATVARTSVVNCVERTVRGLWQGAREPASPTWARLGRAMVVAGVAAPFVGPIIGAGVAMRLVSWVAPNLPEIEVPAEEDTNLVVHLLAEATPTYLGHALVRTGVVLAPVTVAFGVRMEGATATLRIGRGRVSVSEGIHPDVVLVLQGGTEPLLRAVASSIVTELTDPRALEGS